MHYIVFVAEIPLGVRGGLKAGRYAADLLESNLGRAQINACHLARYFFSLCYVLYLELASMY